MSHPFVERLIGSIRRELLDQTLFWTATDLENKLREYKNYYNQHRCHSSREGGAVQLVSGSIEPEAVYLIRMISPVSKFTFTVNWMR